MRSKWANRQCLNDILEIENMNRVSIELRKQEGKFGRTRNAVGIRAARECLHSFIIISNDVITSRKCYHVVEHA